MGDPVPRYERITTQRIDALGVPAETKDLLKRLRQLTDREVHVSRSDESKVRPVWTFTLAPPFRDIQVAVALNVEKVTLYIKARNPLGVDVRSELVQLARLERQFPNPENRNPPSFFSVRGVAPGLLPDPENPLLLVAPQAGRALDALNIYLGVARATPTNDLRQFGPAPTEGDATLDEGESRDLSTVSNSPGLSGGGLNEEVGTVVPEDDESAFPEGVAAYRLHRTYERDDDFSKRVKQTRLKAQGKLACEACLFDFARKYGVTGLGYIEAHHKVPVHKLGGKSNTRAEDLALVCSNCHRMLHRSNPQVTIEELRSRILLGGC